MTGPHVVSDKILFVDDAPEILDVIARMLGNEWPVITARSSADAIERIRIDGPYAIVISDYDMPGQKGDELLAHIHSIAPDTVTMLLTGVVDVDVAIQALHAGRIFRFLEKPCPRERLLAAVRDAIAEYHSRLAVRVHAGELDFSRRVLQSFNGALEQRIGEQAASLVRLQRFVGELNACESLAEIANTAAEVGFELCAGRGVFVELQDCGTDGGRCHVVRGPQMSGERFVQAIETLEGRVGSIVIDDAGGMHAALSSDQRAMLSSVAASTAVAARNQIRRRERDEAQHATILALARLAERRDNETGKHLERVSSYSRLIAEGLREDGWYRDVISDDFVCNLVRSAPLHDIGKVGIPDAILLKPGKLTPDEWEVMKTHTLIGAETLRSVIADNTNQRFLEMSLDIAWCHHEKWDGSGYPRGLAGDAIPLSARILALADVYDALTSVRPYKQAWTHVDSVAWLVAGSGQHFDPHIVAAFTARAERADEIRAQLADTSEDLARVGSRA